MSLPGVGDTAAVRGRVAGRGPLPLCRSVLPSRVVNIDLYYAT